MALKDISWYLGVFLVVSGVLSLLPVPVALYYGEPILALLIRCALFWFLGAIFMKNPRKDLDFRSAMLLIALSLLIIPFFGAIPFFSVMSEGNLEDLVDGYFEAVSGYTTSGLSVLPEPYLDQSSPQYRHSLVFSRTLMEWTGGLGVVVLFLSLLAKGGISTVFLYRVEGGKMIVPGIDHTAKIILRIYLFYTFVGTMLLWILDMHPLYALSTMMSVLSTGGFISLVHGVEVTPLAEFVIFVFLILAAIPFTLDYVLLSGDLKRFFSHFEIRFACYIVASAVLLFTFLGVFSSADFFGSLYKALSLTFSSITTSGYHQDMIDGLSGSSIFLIILLMLIGGCAGSTAGGLKIVRVGVLLKAIRWFIHKLSLPESAVYPFKVAKNVFSDEELRNISLYFFIYIALLLVGTFVIISMGDSGDGSFDLLDAFFMSVSAQSNVGFSTIDIGVQSIIVKVVLIFQMIAGRLEIFPVLALVGYLVKGFEKEVVVIEKEVVEKEKKIKARKKRDQELEDRMLVMRRIMRIGRRDED